MKKFLSLLLCTLMIFSLMGTALADAPGELDGQIVILHTNDVHGEIGNYAAVAGLKAEYQAKGAYVLLVDAGDFSQGDPYVSVSKGKAAVELMELCGYDAVALGNHEFDYGFATLKSNFKDSKIPVLAANVSYDGKLAFQENTVFTAPDGKKIGIFGLSTPETRTKANPKLIEGVTFTEKEELYADAAAQVKALKAEGCDYIICLGHLGIDPESKGNRSIDVLQRVSGIDLFIDGHSHSDLEAVAAATNASRTVNGAVLTSTGTKLAGVGVATINGGKITTEVLAYEDIKAAPAKAVADKAAGIMEQIDKDMGTKFAVTDILLNGERDPGNRTQETNLGDLITDALLWKAKEQGISVDAAVTNGGGIRATIKAGDITKKDVNTVLPFGNTLAIVQVTGAELLEVLEASTFSTPKASGSFPQVAGIEFSLNTSVPYDKGAQYPDSTYFGPKTCKRVTVDTVNGKPFGLTEKYTIVTNDFLAAGGDTYYGFKASTVNYDLGIPMDEAVMEYISAALKGRVTAADYGTGDGEITIFCDACKTFTDVNHGAWYEQYVLGCIENKLVSGTSDTTFSPMVNMDRATFVTMLYNLAGQPDVLITDKFQDVKASDWYAKAVSWAVQAGITAGKTETTFDPKAKLTRQEMAVFIYNYCDAPIVEGGLTYADKDAVAAWAADAVNYCTANEIMAGVGDNTFSPKGSANRAMGAVVLMNLHGRNQAA